MLHGGASYHGSWKGSSRRLPLWPNSCQHLPSCCREGDSGPTGKGCRRRVDGGWGFLDVSGGWAFIPPQVHEMNKRSPLYTILGDVEFADDTVTCSAAGHARAVEALFDSTLGDWKQRQNETERVLVVQYILPKQLPDSNQQNQPNYGVAPLAPCKELRIEEAEITSLFTNMEKSPEDDETQVQESQWDALPALGGRFDLFLCTRK